MPPRIPKACRKRGCKNTTIDRSGFCDEHKGEGWKQYKPGQTRHQRGYGTGWDKTRLRILQRDKGLCQECLRRGAITEATCVDHIDPLANGGSHSDDNLQSLCTPCHRVKTARERLPDRRGGG
ncbi:HNH endonuclease [Buttiauxella sp. B2]|uniref:HNH endonuclease n=1 Tax=Buttiauxella sp. B2 TaxID=2587812 RepID=UPI0011229AAF|nr:HNH endonuclease signature motif containing protein [Buttiauxella sp. B2]TNV14914.1 HNH endonuclease [Buttiauxella sp. B2]